METYTLKRSHPRFPAVFEKITSAVSSGMTDEEIESKILPSLPALISPGIGIEKWTKGKFEYKNRQIYFKGEVIDSRLHNRLLAMAEEGKDPTPWFKFWEKLSENPSYRSVHQLHGFMENANIAVSANGDVLGYKAIRKDNWCDFHSNQYKNTVGSVHKLDRNKVSDDPEVACHEGFHVGSLQYAQSFNAGHNQLIIICAIHPKNVVCVPKDANQGKMRTCEYKVIGVYGQPLSDTIEEEISSDDVENKQGEIFEKNKAPAENIEIPAEYENWRSLNLDNLRKFASRTLKIVGASRMTRMDLEARIESIL